MSKVISVSFSDDIYERLNASANRSGLSRSAYITMALKGQFEKEEVIDKMPDLMDLLKKNLEKEK